MNLSAEEFENRVKRTIEQFSLLDKKEKVLVAASGGKDSTVIAYLLKKFGYDIEALTVDVSIGKYTKENLENLKKFCSDNGIKLHVLSIRKETGYSVCYIRSILKSKGTALKSCTICGVLRRYLINKHAKKLGADKLVTGHNLDDEAQSFVMNMARNTLWLAARLGPKTGLQEDSKFVQRVKPLYLISEKDVEAYSRLMKFPVQYSRCPCSADSFRRFIGNMLDKWEKDSPMVKENIVKYFLTILPKLKEKYAEGEIAQCRQCREPSSHKLCKACEILGNLQTVQRSI